MNNLSLYLLTVLIWGSTWIAVEFQIPDGGAGAASSVAAEVSIFYRYMIASIVIFIWCWARRLSLRFDARTHGLFLVMGFLMFCLNYLCVYIGQGYIASALMAIIFSTVRGRAGHGGAVPDVLAVDPGFVFVGCDRDWRADRDAGRLFCLSGEYDFAKGAKAKPARHGGQCLEHALRRAADRGHIAGPGAGLYYGLVACLCGLAPLFGRVRIGDRLLGLSDIAGPDRRGQSRLCHHRLSGDRHINIRGV